MTQQSKSPQIFIQMDRVKAAEMALEGEKKVLEEPLLQDFTTGIFDSVHAAIERRRLAGLSVDPTNPEEVKGLVKAAMGGNDHVSKARDGLTRYVVGRVQTDDFTLRQLREGSLTGGQ